MLVVYNIIKLFKYFLIIAIADGIMENDAFKHNRGDLNNETWTQLLLDFGFFDEQDNITMNLRRRFVLGAADWLAGNNGSLRNDKDLLGYTDTQWEYIWNTMLVDGAWAVPGVTDSEGNVIKENDAPELLIKYIAHELKCHILVFDLVLDRIHFISGNHLKQNNVVFESPLLLYATGSHFQSVFQYDHEFFINLAQDLETENVGIAASVGSTEGTNTEPCKGHDKESSKEGLSRASDMGPKRPNSAGPCSPTDDGEEKKKQSSIKPQVMAAKDVEVDAQYSQSFGKDSVEMADDMEFEMISKIRKKDRTPAQQKTFERIRIKRYRRKESPVESATRKAQDRESKKQRRQDESQEIKEKRCIKNREHMAEVRRSETEKQNEERLRKIREHTAEVRRSETKEQNDERLRKDREHTAEVRRSETKEQNEERLRKTRKHMVDVRSSETIEQNEERLRKKRENIAEVRRSETEKQRQERCKKNRKHMEKTRKSNSELQRLNKFQETVKYGPFSDVQSVSKICL